MAEFRPTYSWNTEVTVYARIGTDISERELLNSTQRDVTISDIRDRMRGRFADGFRACDLTNELRGLFPDVEVKSILILGAQGCRKLLMDLMLSNLVRVDPSKREGKNLHYMFVEGDNQ